MNGNKFKHKNPYSFISCPCDTGKRSLIPKIVSVTGKMTNEWSTSTIFLTKFSKFYSNECTRSSLMHLRKETQ